METSGSLFDDLEEKPSTERLGPGAVILRRFAVAEETELMAAFENVVAAAPFRHMVTPGGFTMSVEMTNCGPLGWISDRIGYRYESFDPLSGKAWPAMPASFSRLAVTAAAEAGFGGYVPDACLINRYAPGARLTLHQDKDEQDFKAPIVSVSLGLPATFQFGGLTRADKLVRVQLSHGDIVVWGGPDRLRYHGVLALKEGHHPLTGNYRVNLTFRRAG